jgi:hypothetical protein
VKRSPGHAWGRPVVQVSDSADSGFGWDLHGYGGPTLLLSASASTRSGEVLYIPLGMELLLSIKFIDVFTTTH